jgi:hypothetical protein
VYLPLTPTQQRMYELLADGLPHSVEELQALLPDELSRLSVKAHIWSIRRKLLTMQIVGQKLNGKFTYRLAGYQPADR